LVCDECRESDEDVIGVGQCQICGTIHDLHLRVFWTKEGILRVFEPRDCCGMPLVNLSNKCPECGELFSGGGVLGTLAAALEKQASSSSG